MAASIVDTLLKDHQTELLRDRRSVQRKPFCRHVHITTGRRSEIVYEAVSRDVSPQGMGTVGGVDWARGTIGSLTIYLLNNKSVIIEAEARWTEPYGMDYYLTGWTFREC